MSAPTWTTAGAVRATYDTEAKHVVVDVSTDGKIVLWVGENALGLTREGAISLANALFLASGQKPDVP